MLKSKTTFITLLVITVFAMAACSESNEPNGTPGQNDTTSLGVPAPGQENNVDEMIVNTDADIEAVGSMGMPAPGQEDNIDEMIVLSDELQETTGRPATGVLVRDLPELEPDDHSGSNPAPNPIQDGGPANPDTCEGVLLPPPPEYTLESRSATKYASADNVDIVASCTSTYEDVSSGSFLTVGVSKMVNEDPAIAQYALATSEFRNGEFRFGEELDDNFSGFSVRVDQGGISNVYMLRSSDRLVSVLSGPDSRTSPWSPDVMADLAHSVASRVQ